MNRFLHHSIIIHSITLIPPTIHLMKVMDGEVAIEEEEATEVAGETWLITSSTWLNSMLITVFLSVKRLSKQRKAGASVKEENNGEKREQWLSHFLISLKLTQVNMWLLRLKSKTKPSGLGREIVSLAKLIERASYSKKTRHYKLSKSKTFQLISMSEENKLSSWVFPFLFPKQLMSKTRILLKFVVASLDLKAINLERMSLLRLKSMKELKSCNSSKQLLPWMKPDLVHSMSV